jgi:hypothetical protein
MPYHIALLGGALCSRDLWTRGRHPFPSQLLWNLTPIFFRGLTFRCHPPLHHRHHFRILRTNSAKESLIAIHQAVHFLTIAGRSCRRHLQKICCLHLLWLLWIMSRVKPLLGRLWSPLPTFRRPKRSTSMESRRWVVFHLSKAKFSICLQNWKFCRNWL